MHAARSSGAPEAVVPGAPEAVGPIGCTLTLQSETRSMHDQEMEIMSAPSDTDPPERTVLGGTVLGRTILGGTALSSVVIEGGIRC